MASGVLYHIKRGRCRGAQIKTLVYISNESLLFMTFKFGHVSNKMLSVKSVDSDSRQRQFCTDRFDDFLMLVVCYHFCPEKTGFN